jgi:sugar lactone lactonase YvrE
VGRRVGSRQVRRYAPDGVLANLLVLPAPQTTSVAFAGEDLRTLVMTTATSGLPGEQSSVFPDSERVFAVRVDVPGQPVSAWSGSAAF